MRRFPSEGRGRRGRVALAVLGALAFAAANCGPASAATAAQKCAAAKIKAAGKKASCLLSLDSKEAASGDPKDAGKVQKCKDKLSSTFGKAEGKGGCATTNDEASVEAI